MTHWFETAANPKPPFLPGYAGRRHPCTHSHALYLTALNLFSGRTTPPQNKMFTLAAKYCFLFRKGLEREFSHLSHMGGLIFFYVIQSTTTPLGTSTIYTRGDKCKGLKHQGQSGRQSPKDRAESSKWKRCRAELQRL